MYSVVAYNTYYINPIKLLPFIRTPLLSVTISSLEKPYTLPSKFNPLIYYASI